MKEIILGILGFLFFLSIVFSMIFLVFRNLYYYQITKYNLYAIYSSIIFFVVIIIFFMISHFSSGFLIVFIKRFLNNIIGVFFIFYILFIITEIIRLIKPINSQIFNIILTIGIIIILISIYTAQTINIKNIEFKSDKIDKEYKFAYISDVHIGSNSYHSIDAIVNIILKQDVDFLLIGGDFIDENHVIKEDLSSLNKLKIPIYYSFGNHEKYIQKDIPFQIAQKYNLKILENQVANFDKNLTIIGVEDNFNKLDLILNNLKYNSSKYTILLNHQPTQLEIANKNKLDLMLSGHTHNGQIFPFTYLVKLRYKNNYGLYKEKNTNLYVSSGVETWGPNMRFLTQSEILIITLKPKK